jgi:2-oxo-3-hexenedioate decarboxylase
MADIHAIAALLDTAARTARSVPQISASQPLTLEQAYAVQKASIARRLASGERLAGIKMGFTSRAKMVQMGVSDLIFGRLTDRMLVEDGGSIDLASTVHPRVEPEIAFLLRAPLEGRVSPLQALAAVDAIAPAMEIIDSRYENFQFSLEDVVADNASSSGFVVGAWHRPDLDFSNLGMVMSFDGQPVQIGSSAAILGHPLRGLAAAARMVSAAGERLEAGWIVMAGAATAAEALRPDVYVETEVQGLGRTAFSVRG